MTWYWAWLLCALPLEVDCNCHCTSVKRSCHYIVTANLAAWFLFLSFDQALEIVHDVTCFALLLGLAILVGSPALRSTGLFSFSVVGPPIPDRYVDAVGFFLNLVGAYGLCATASPLPARMRKVIAHVAGTTFVLYPFHRPLIQMASYLGPADASMQTRGQFAR